MPWLFPILAYLVGSVPFGVLIARSKGINIRQRGSGNVGATNVFRVVGRGFGIFCLLLDFLKGFLPVVLATNLLRITGETPAVPLPFLWDFTGELPADRQLYVHSIQVLTALAAIMGHNYSIFLRGKGGKGIATSAGVLMALMPLILLGAFLVFSATFYFSGYVSLGSIAAALSIPILRHLADHLHHIGGDKSQPSLWEAGTWNKPLMVFALIAAALAVWRHRSNIQRILAGTEDRLSSRIQKTSRTGRNPEQKGSDHES
ncbi:MAG: glycerol-3-phosphate 1-O-acyltransferase PlsY [Roseibacillus sp.]|nr:glycerol-3-phosphate 1-O-acyltransferase PlsY [Roseibacillus sp.]NRB26299.1 glycerol-3-phosphate 1-O-acyltransferase PlsY [Roseibacillus sp.]